MKKSICGADCDNCGYGKNSGCKGCVESHGCPFGKKCFIAQYINMGGEASYNLFKEKLSEEFIVKYEDKVVTDNFTQLAELLGADYRHFLRVVRGIVVERSSKRLRC